MKKHKISPLKKRGANKRRFQKYRSKKGGRTQDDPDSPRLSLPVKLDHLNEGEEDL